MSAENRHPFEILQELVLESDRRAIEGIRSRLQVQENETRNLEQGLPDTIVRLFQTDSRVGESLAPWAAQALSSELEKRPERFAGLLIPVILPAIRKAVFAQIRDYLRSIEQLVERTLTLESVRWKIIAWQTGVPAHEIALRRSFLARVEELLLVHVNTGLMVGHVGLVNRPERDPDLVSGMLSAVQAFVRESFAEGEDSTELDRVEFGTHELWIARGQYTTLAAAIRGFGDPRLRERLHDAVARIESRHRRRLPGFDGDQSLRSSTDGILREYLEERPRGGRGWGLWLVAVALVAFVLAISVFVFEGQNRRAGLEGWARGLQEVPGLVVLSTKWRGPTLRVEGLRDPLVPVPKPPRVEGLEVKVRWRAYASAEPPIVLKRVRGWLGTSPDQKLRLAGSTLVVTGTASSSWLERVEKTAGVVPGVGAVDLRGTVNSDLRRLQRALSDLSDLSVGFALGSTRPLASEGPGAVLDAVRRIDRLAVQAGVRLTLTVRGTADPLGTVRSNQRLSRARSQFLIKALESLPLRRAHFIGEARLSAERQASVFASRDAISPWVSYD